MMFSIHYMMIKSSPTPTPWSPSHITVMNQTFIKVSEMQFFWQEGERWETRDGAEHPCHMAKQLQKVGHDG